MAAAEYHVASFVVHTKPADSGEVTDQLADLHGVEVHGDNNGKLVVTAEATDVRELADLTDSIQQLPNVVAVAPVYHEFTDA